LNLCVDRPAAFFKTLPSATKIATLNTEEVKSLEEEIPSIDNEEKLDKWLA